MITKTTNLSEAYNALFEQIKEASNGNINVNNIESLYGNIEEIAQVNTKFLRLPLDEPMFEIDANTRRITIPDAFRSNGLSVQGDHLAEIVFFCIDRYYDYTDLSSTDITINWKMGNNAGKTKNFIMSKEIIPGSIVFGWPINNVITEKSGSLTFAVEFRKQDVNTGIVTYDFNTLSATITIKDGLVIGDDVEVTDLDNDILSILTDSVYQEDGSEAAIGNIQWISGNGNGLVRGDVVSVDGNDVPVSIVLKAYQNPIMLDTELDTQTGEPRSVAIKLFGEAYVDDGTIIKYTNTLNQQLQAAYIKIENNLILVEDIENLDDNKLYFNANGNIVDIEDITEDMEVYESNSLPVDNIYYVVISSESPIAYAKATEEQMNKWGTVDQVDLFIQAAYLEAAEDGTYVMRAQGIKQDNAGRKIGNGEVSSCTPIIIPKVETPSGVEINKSSIDISDESGYSIDPETSTNTVFLTDEGGTLAARAIVDNFGALQFVWQKKNGTAFEDIEEDVPYQIANNNSVLSISAPGEYKVKVKNFQNGKYSDEVQSEVYIASDLASVVDSAICRANNVIIGSNNRVDFNSDGTLSQRSVTLSITADGPERGILSYEWRKGDEVVGTAQQLNVNVEGDYVPVVKNSYNGSIYTKILPAIFVNDLANDG